MKTSETLNGAADLIEERGWTTGGGWTDLGGDTPLCIQGALAAAEGAAEAVGFRCPAYWAVADYIGIKSGLFNWNDNLVFEGGSPSSGWAGGSRAAGYARGSETVIATLRAAAVIEAIKEAADDDDQAVTHGSRLDLAAAGAA